MIFAVLAQKRGINHQCNYRLASTINQPLDAPSDVAAVARVRQEFELASGLTPREFERAYRAVVRMVTAMYERRRHDTLFKGKWYLRLLETAAPPQVSLTKHMESQIGWKERSFRQLILQLRGQSILRSHECVA